jgi:hypothetical protein
MKVCNDNIVYVIFLALHAGLFGIKKDILVGDIKAVDMCDKL